MGILRHIYNKNFFTRGTECIGFDKVFFERYPNLMHEEFSCASDKGDLIKGFVFMPEKPKALIVWTNGFAKNSEDNFSLAKYFCDEGFAVLLFDGIGIGFSEGEKMYGLPQHILDMKAVLETVKRDQKLSALPLLLFGHSWGGFAAATAADFGDFPIRGILLCAPFNSIADAVLPVAVHRYGNAIKLLVPKLEKMQIKLFSEKQVLASAADTLAKLDCPVRVYHSTDDVVVLFDSNFTKIKKALAGKANASMIELHGRNHNLMTPPDIDREKRACAKNGQNERLTELMFTVDEDLAKEFTEFFNSCLE